MSRLDLFKALVAQLAPIVLPLINPKLAPITDDLTQGIQEAEDMSGARGVDKLNHVVNVGNLAADAVNKAAGKTVVNVHDLQSAVSSAVSTTISILNLIHKGK